MSKVSVFERSRIALGLPEGEYNGIQQDCCNILAKSFKDDSNPYKAIILKRVLEGKLSTKQCITAIAYAQKHEGEAKSNPAGIDEADLDKECGVGVVYTEEELRKEVDASFAKHAEEIETQRYRFVFKRIIGEVLKTYKWADVQIIDKIISEKALEVLGSPEDEKNKIDPNATTKKEVKPAQKNETKDNKNNVNNGNKNNEDNNKEQVKKYLTIDNVQDCKDILEEVFKSVPPKNYHEQPCEKVIKEHEGITLGHPITRFPPEPNGYLHLGHAKAMFLDFGYAAVYGGKTIMRFDDTNPAAEEGEYIESILADVQSMGYKYDRITYTSDYFDRLLVIAEEFIKKGLAYADNQTKEEMSSFRENKQDPPNRNRPIEESLEIFHKMQRGYYDEGTVTLRLKIDNQNPNPCMRDPVAYRIKYDTHPRQGNKYCVYPSYDYSHCLIDSFEHITHSLCTLEFNIRRPLYEWVVYNSGLYRPMQWEMSRLNVDYNVMSKRILLRLVKDGYVSGWDDPLMLTIRGLHRRGFTSGVINEFIRRVGISRNDQFIESALLESIARDAYDESAPRTMVAMDPIQVLITHETGDKSKYVKDGKITYPIHPKHPERGTYEIPWDNKFYISSEDFKEENAKGYIRLTPTQSVGLKYGPIISVAKVNKNKEGKVVNLICNADWDRTTNVKCQIQWVPVKSANDCTIHLYEKLFTIPQPNSQNFIESLNPNRHTIVEGKCLSKINDDKVGSIYQFERIGYFIKDKDSTDKHPVFIRVTPLRAGF